MRVLVIGGTNFIGPHVVRRLAGMGHEVTVYHTGAHEADMPAAVRHVHDERARIPVSGIADGARDPAPDVVVHMAPIAERDTRVVMDAFAGVAGRVVALSSGDVYRAYGRLIRTEPGEPDPAPLAEDAPLREGRYPLRGRTPSGDEYDKILAEEVILGCSGLPGTVLRLPFVYGPGDGGRLFEHVKRMDDGRRVIPLAEDVAAWRSSWAYVENVAEAIALAVADERSAGRVFNVAEPEPISTADWVRRVGVAAGWDGEVVVVPKGALPADPDGETDFRQDLTLDSGRIRHELGYAEPVPREEALRRTVAWHRANPPVEIDPARFDYAAEDAALALSGRGTEKVR